jgi:hypothetical protein
MNYYLNLFSVQTWEAFQNNGSSISGFSKHQKKQAGEIEPGSIFLCYLVKLSRWVGALEVISPCFEDSAPLFRQSDDPFIMRFNVKPLMVLPIEQGLPIQEEFIWDHLQWTKDLKKGQVGWGANFQRSLRQFPSDDGKYLYDLLESQLSEKKIYDLSSRDIRNINSQTKVKTTTGDVDVDIPDEETEDESPQSETLVPLRESFQIQSSLANIGAKMGFKIWLPRSDKTKIFPDLNEETKTALLEDLPISYDDATTKTIENIDVLWLKSRSIIRAFEVEHTTAVYSGLLRMADLVSLVPNINILLHIVAPSERREKVFREINRPVFHLMEGQLAKRCTFISYDSVVELSNTPNLEHMNDSIIDEYIESRDY